MTQPSSIQSSFSKQTSVSRSFQIQKGQLNHYRFRQAVLNEHVETARSVQDVVESGVIVGQIFKASQDNINGLMLTLESAAWVVLDDFEGYANDGALQAVWVESGTDLAVLSTTIVKTGTQSMELPMDATLDDEWQDTISAKDYTAYTFSLDYYQTVSVAFGTIDFYIGDGTNTKSITLTVQNENEWTHFDIDETALSEDVGTTDMANITEIGFRLSDTFPNATAYVDDLSATPAPGSVNLKLFDMTSTLPVDGVTKLSDGTQYTQLGDLGLNGGNVVSEVPLQLVGGKREYFVTKFAAGAALEIPGNQVLTKGNYYALTINYVDTDVSVYGSNPDFATTYYNNGFAFTAASESAVMSAIGDYNDIQFGIFSTQSVHLNTFLKEYDAVPGQAAKENVRVEDMDMKITGIITQNSTPAQVILAEFRDRTFYFPKGGKFEVNHSDDPTDDTTQVNILIGYIYEPPAANG